MMYTTKHLGRSFTDPERSSTSQRTGQLVGSVASLLAQGVLKGSASNISNTVSELLDVLLIRRRNPTDSVWNKLAVCPVLPMVCKDIPFIIYDALFSPIVSRAFSSIWRFASGGMPKKYT